MAVQTVLGNIRKEDVGIALMHEHIFMDLRKKFDKTDLEQTDDLVTEERIPELRKNHRLLKDNLFLSNEELAEKEVQLFCSSGGKTIVNMSNYGMGSNLSALKNISHATGVNIIECTGFYTEATHPEWMYDYSVNQMAELFIRDITEGIGDSGSKAGIIGEIGTSAVITNRERKVLDAACIAQKETGASISVHIDPWVENGLDVLNQLNSNGADLTRVVIGHTDAVINLDYIRAMLDRGAVIEMDNFAKRYETPGLHFDTDEQRIEAIVQLISEGYQDQILMSTDICLKTDLYQYGGGGYGHIPRTIIPKLRERGIADTVIEAITEKTPARLLNIEAATI